MYLFINFRHTTVNHIFNHFVVNNIKTCDNLFLKCSSVMMAFPNCW